MTDSQGQLWFGGENKNGCLGTNDGKNRIVPQLSNYFSDKRIVDMSCGNGFSVVVAETYDMVDEERNKYFLSLKDRIANVENAKEFKRQEINSIKRDVRTARKFISERKTKSTAVPEDLRHKIQTILARNAERTGITYSTMSNRQNDDDLTSRNNLFNSAHGVSQPVQQLN